MSARDNLAGILEQWLRLTREESAAIQTRGWSALRQIQARKAALREPLASAVRQRNSVPPHLRAQVGRIISLLTRNARVLADQLRQARAGQETLDQARRNLQRIARCYARRPHAARWHSYS